MKGPPLYNLILHTKWKELKVCEVVVRLLQRIGWLQGKICRWTLGFGNSKIWHRHYEIGVLVPAGANNMPRLLSLLDF